MPAALLCTLLAAALLTACSAQDAGAPAQGEVRETTADDCGTPPGKDEAGLVGLSGDAAEERVKADGLVYRVVCVDGKPLDSTADARADRVNAGLQDGVVTFTWRG